MGREACLCMRPGRGRLRKGRLNPLENINVFNLGDFSGLNHL